MQDRPFCYSEVVVSELAKTPGEPAGVFLKAMRIQNKQRVFERRLAVWILVRNGITAYGCSVSYLYMSLRWKIYEGKRLWRKYVRQEGSKRRLIDCVGPLWLFLHRAQVEYKLSLWNNSEGWYAIDIAVPHLKKGVEADGWVHKSRKNKDYIRDYRLETELGWEILRINDDETKQAPRVVRKRVRKFLKG